MSCQLRLFVHPRRIPCLYRAGSVGTHIALGLARGLSSTNSAKDIDIRKKMVPLIKLIHPDLFAQDSLEVRRANQTSLKDLNTLIDAAEALEAHETNYEFTLPNISPSYRFTLFHRRSDKRLSGVATEISEKGGLSKLQVVLNFPPPLLAMRNPIAIRAQLRRELDRLLAAVSGITEMEGCQSNEMSTEEGWGDVDSNFQPRTRRSDNGDRIFARGPPRDGLKTERSSTSARSASGPKTKEDFDRLVLEHAGEHIGKPMPYNRDAGLFGGAFGRHGLRRKGGQGFGLGSRESEGRRSAKRITVERSRQVDKLLSSGQVQLSGVPIVREASALRRLHHALARNFERLELDDEGLWGNVVLVLRAKVETYEVQAHTRGPLLFVPEDFKDRDLVSFLEDTMLCHS
ncbi:unnamed protein product [Discosporangium mesarthrocarpum]